HSGVVGAGRVGRSGNEAGPRVHGEPGGKSARRVGDGSILGIATAQLQRGTLTERRALIERLAEKRRLIVQRADFVRVRTDKASGVGGDDEAVLLAGDGVRENVGVGITDVHGLRIDAWLLA